MSIAKFTPKIWYLPLVVAKKVTAAKGIFSFHVFSKLCIFVICTTGKIQTTLKITPFGFKYNSTKKRASRASALRADETQHTGGLVLTQWTSLTH